MMIKIGSLTLISSFLLEKILFEKYQDEINSQYLFLKSGHKDLK